MRIDCRTPRARAPLRNCATGVLAGIALVGIALLGSTRRACAQAMLADDIVIISKGLREQESERTTSHLGESPGAGGSRLRIVPGSGAPRLGENTATTSVSQHDVLSAAAGGPRGVLSRAEPVIAAPAALAPMASPSPQYSFLEVPTEDDEGPADGLTLDIAIDRLVRANYDLRTKFQEIPKADADVLSAGLRGNPMVFGSADNVPYGSYSPQRPGENSYDVTVIQPVDINHKRDMRIAVASRAKRVLEAQYQDAVRLEIDNLYTVFVDVLAMRESVRYLEASVIALDEVIRVVKQQLRGEQIPVTTLDRLSLQRESVALALEEARAAQTRAREVLATLLDLPVGDDRELAIRGKLLTPKANLPPVEDLVGIALGNRPDVIAYRLGVQRARTDVGLAQREAFPDIFVLYTPWGFRNNVPTGGQNASSWGVGALVAVPIFNRNQGNVRRAQINVAQTRTELGGLEKHVETDVRTAHRDVVTTRSIVERLEHNVLPRARSIRDQTLKLFRTGHVSAIEYLNAQREYSEIVRQYRDALIKQRRADLHLNTAVALRIIF